MPRPVFLLTDFGLRDGYVGVLRAVIARLAPGAPVHDLLHDVPPQDVLGARLKLAACLPYLPPDAVVCAVVDPGVGTDRRAIAIEAEHDDGRRIVVIAPDNGLTTSLVHDDRPPYDVPFRARRAWVLDPDSVAAASGEATGPGLTFDGRDLFAPAAAHVAAATPVDRLGRSIDPSDVGVTPAPALATRAGVTVGRVAWIDRFGDLVSDVPAGSVPADVNGRVRVRVGHRDIIGLQTAFAEVPIGSRLAYVGSLGTFEVAVRNGSAARELGVEVGAPFEVEVGTIGSSEV